MFISDFAIKRPSITGHAYVTGEALLYRDPNDPFADGLRVT